MTKSATWRSYVRARVGESGERIFDTLIELMEGNPVAQRTADGRFVDPIIPTPAVRLDAAKHLSETVFGRAASQTEQVAAEGAEAEREAIRALSDLEPEAHRAAWRLPALPEDAVLVPQAPLLRRHPRPSPSATWPARRGKLPKMTEPTTLRRALPAELQAHPLIVVRELPQGRAMPRGALRHLPSAPGCRHRRVARDCGHLGSHAAERARGGVHLAGLHARHRALRLHEAGVPQAGLRDADAQGVRTLHAVHPRDDVRSALALAMWVPATTRTSSTQHSPQGSLHMAEKPSIEIKSVQLLPGSTSPASPPRPSSPPEA